MAIALVIFAITYLFIGLRQIPRMHIDRPAGALAGAVAMVVFGVLTLDQAFAAVDMHTLLLLLGMMIITVYLRHAGFFELMADRILSLSRTPLQLLIFVTLSSGVLSALFVNDTICLLYTPILLGVTAHLGVNPVPYLLGLATASNVGSVMTITGNPQNMLIGIYSKIPYLTFLGALFPVALAGFAVIVLVIRALYPRDITSAAFPERPKMPEYYVRKRLLVTSLLVCGGVLMAFSIGRPYSLSAAAGAVVLLLIGRVPTERILEGVDWTLLLFFCALFIVMRGVEASGLSGLLIAKAQGVADLSGPGRIAGFSVLSALLSNLVSNVPAVMLLKPLTEALGGGDGLWLALAMSSTLAGNFTLIGSVANLIVVQQARKTVDIGFLEYFRAGAVITAATLAIGVIVLALPARQAHGAEQRTGARTAKYRTITVSPVPPKTPEKTFSVVLLCDTEPLRAKGLQGFRPLGPAEAALFLFPRPEAATFWMGSVSFPIDIIFVDEQGTVVRTHHNVQPGSKDLYPSGEPVKLAIETAGGSGIRAGDRVRIR